MQEEGIREVTMQCKSATAIFLQDVGILDSTKIKYYAKYNLGTRKYCLYLKSRNTILQKKLVFVIESAD